MKKLLLILFLLPVLALQATVHEVQVLALTYSPADVTIALGDTVRFTWVEGTHATVSGVDENDMVFDSFPSNPDQLSHDLVLDAAGFYPYFCAFHTAQNMVGSITVEGGETMTSGPCSDLFISEYIEGSSFNKALELFNPTESPIDLSNYVLRRFNNGGLEVSFADTLEGTLNPSSAFLIVDFDAGAELAGDGDLMSDITSVNGDDAIELLNGTTVIDRIGVVGEDPGTEWEVGSGSTANNTLRRKSFIQEGQLDWSIGATEWDVFPSDDFAGAGSHSMIACSGEVVPFASLSISSLTVPEEGGPISVSVLLSNPNEEETVVTLEAVSGTAQLGLDFEAMPQTFTLGTGMTEGIYDITIVNDDEMEPDESFQLSLVVDSNGEVGTSIATITINDDDTPVQELSIEEATQIDANGNPINITQEASVVGITHGVNLNAAGHQFALIDATGGMQVFSFDQIDGYSYSEGDELRVTGTISQFNGLVQMAPTSIEVLSSGNDLFAPVTVTELNESTESEHIRLECVEITNPADWDGEGTGDNLTVTDGTNQFLMRIDDMTDFFGTDVPTGVFSVNGIGGQFDQSSPYTEGYQILPMYLSAFDFGGSPVAQITSTSTGMTFTFSATPGLDSYEWNFGDGSTASGQTVEHTYEDEGDFTINLNFTGEGTCTNSGTTSTTINIMGSGIEDFTMSTSISPNPASQFVNVLAEYPIEQIRLLNIAGQEVASFDGAQQLEQSIPVLDLPKGIYLVEVKADAHLSMSRLLVE